MLPLVANAIRNSQSNSARQADYSGFNRDTWTMRDFDSHRRNCQKILKENTKTNIRKKESELGVRYSILLSLPYFNPVRGSPIIDGPELARIQRLFRMILGVAGGQLNLLRGAKAFKPSREKEGL